MLEESSQCLHTQPALHRQIKTASIREEDHADKVFGPLITVWIRVISSAILAFVTIETVPS
jgi:hypothetical protein